MNGRIKRVTWLAASLAALWLLGGRAFPLAAHGGGTLQLANVPVGTLQVSVWTAPTTLRAGAPMHVTVSIATASTGTPVLDAAILVHLQTTTGTATLQSAPATTRQSVNKLFYESDLAAPAPGQYRIAVEISGSGGQGTVTFPLAIQPAVPVWPLAAGLASTALIGGALGFRYWRQRQWPAAQTAQKRRQAS
jgi:hypothetical protein